MKTMFLSSISFFERKKGFSSLTVVDGCFQFSNFPSFSRFPTSLKHRREKNEWDDLARIADFQKRKLSLVGSRLTCNKH